jgi:hydroxymethylpyrimidine pyrophosphatase-like HAD family hydrolase
MGLKILVSDFDGTLAHRDHVPLAVSRALLSLVEAGWELILATGRIYASVRPHLESVPTTMPLILYDGARIVSSDGGDVLFERLLAGETASEALRIGWNSGLEVQVYGDEEILIRPDESDSERYFRKLAVPVRNDLVEPRVDEDVYRVIFYGDPVVVRRLARRMASALGEAAAVTLAGDGFLDILAPGVSKGAALEHLLASMGRPGCLVCAGDHHNDRELLLLADLAAVPDDAANELKAVSHFIFPSASEEGFVSLARFLLESDGVPCKGDVVLTGHLTEEGAAGAGCRRSIDND